MKLSDAVSQAAYLYAQHRGIMPGVIARDRATVARACAEIAEEIMNELPDDAAYVGQAAGACGDIATRIRALAARLEAGEGVDDAE